MSKRRNTSNDSDSRSESSRLVYTTDGGRIDPEKNNDEPVSTYTDGVVRVRREVKGRGGKTVTTVTGLPQTGNDLKAYAKQLKQYCGTGGAVKQGVIEIQGDQVEKLLQCLTKDGYQAKQAGG
ncbi:translation initiation factor [Zooshikella marina]|uniref:translation initiation factor n=1 Tax=Zooshikella ganghwensis TaxID=202772 RepID=UPI001BAF2020|nr:translation initiation factor [Zooshikella ganghwensis]MBU2706151.1 translation initiation factor [Zooshikella ganghwensis]